MWKYYIPIVGIGIMFSNWTKFSENDPTGIHWAMTAFWQSIWTTVILIIGIVRTVHRFTVMDEIAHLHVQQERWY